MRGSKKPRLLIFSAPSGSGKTTLVHKVLAKLDFVSFSVSVTTRKPRAHEIHGKDYYFISIEEFKDKLSKSEFLEWQEVYPGRFYGTLRAEIDRINEEGKIALLDVDVMGGINVKHEFGSEAASFFIQAPSLQELKDRLIRRGTDNADEIDIRVAKASKELGYSIDFDHIILNDDLDLALERILVVLKNYFPTQINI